MGRPLCGQATLFLQEGFNYPAGPLANNAPWTDITSLIVATNTSLTYSNLADFSPPSQACAVNAGSTALSYRPLGTVPMAGAVYLSFLINFAVKPGSYYIGGLLQGTNAPPGGAAADPLDLIDNTSGSGFKLGIRAKGGTTTYVANSLIPMSVGTTYFVVLKYNFTNGLASLYLNPAPGSLEPASPDAASTPASVVPDLSYLYLRSGSTSAGNFLVGTLRVGSTWSDVTPVAAAPNGSLAFAVQPTGTTAGTALPAITVQVQNSTGINVASNNVPVSLSVNGGTFASGTTTVSTGPAGQAIFNNLVMTTAGNFTLTASASGFNSGTSTNFTVLPAGIDHYTLSAPGTELVGVPFVVTGAVWDAYGNLVTTDSSVPVTLGSNPANILYDANNSGVFGTNGDNTIVPANGRFTVNTLANLAQTVTLTASDSNGHSGASSLITVYSNTITAQGYMLNAFLDSLEVDKYWLVGTSVNWLTGAVGGSGANMTAGTDSHCSAFAGAVTELLGVYLLRQPDVSDINLANHQAVWFVTNTVGWVHIPSMIVAQQMVNTGELVMASYEATSGSGHIAVLRASNRTTSDITANGPEECQSGDYNFADTNVVTGFNQHPGAFPSGIQYYGHAINYPVSPITMQISQPGVASGNFQARATTIVGRSYQIEISTNLANWTTLVSGTNSEAPLTFFTTNSFADGISNSARKYYRVMVP